MSGGSLNYFYLNLENHVGDFKDKELDDLLKDLADLAHAREWYLSADTGVGEWREARAAFKAKWFTWHGQQERVEKYLAEITHEIKEMFGIDLTYCRTCKHWTDQGDYSEYGMCEYEKGCLTHRSEDCKRWEKKE